MRQICTVQQRFTPPRSYRPKPRMALSNSNHFFMIQAHSKYTVMQQISNKLCKFKNTLRETYTLTDNTHHKQSFRFRQKKYGARVTEGSTTNLKPDVDARNNSLLENIRCAEFVASDNPGSRTIGQCLKARPIGGYRQARVTTQPHNAHTTFLFYNQRAHHPCGQISLGQANLRDQRF